VVGYNIRFDRRVIHIVVVDYNVRFDRRVIHIGWL
jgi:hypothetical protein